MSLLTHVAAFVAVGALVYVSAIIWSGSEATLVAIERLGCTAILMGTLVASMGYLVRFVRWDAILKWQGHRVPAVFNLRVYLSGLALTSSPGKLGETVRSVLLLNSGVPLPHSLAAFFADRLSDVVGVALLGTVAGWAVSQRQPLLEAIFILVLGATFTTRSVMLSAPLRRRMALLDSSARARRVLAVLSAPIAAWAEVWTVRRALLCVTLAFLAYGLQGLVFSFYVSATGTSLPWTTCVAIFASATLIGAATMIPGGLGAMEASLVYQLMETGVPRDAAVAVALVTRASTFWFGLLLGVIMLLTFSRRERGQAELAFRRHPNVR